MKEGVFMKAVLEYMEQLTAKEVQHSQKARERG
jgi:hypothetical protein